MSIVRYGSAARNASIRAEFRRGTTVPELAVRHQLTKGRVSQILKSYGLGRRDGGQHVNLCNLHAGRPSTESSSLEV